MINGQTIRDIPDPREIFRQLPKKGRVRKLRDQQLDVLNWYWPSHVRDQKVAIELPTGAGKSLLAILIGKAWLDANRRVAVLAGTKFLQEDLQKKATEVGVETVIIPGEWSIPEEQRPDRARNVLRYRRKGVIGIFNYWSYLYSGIQKPDLLVIDDAHAFEEALYSFYTFEISRLNHEELWDKVHDYLAAKGGHYSSWLEAFKLKVFRQDAFETLYVVHTQDIANIVRPYFRQLQVGKHRPDFDFIRNEMKLDQYLVLLSKDSIVLTPHVRPIDGHERLQEIESILYMSATLGSNEVLYKSLGSFSPISVVSWETLPTRIGTIGKRLILPVPINESNYGISAECLMYLQELAQSFDKLLVFTVSDNEAQYLQTVFRGLGHDCTIYNSRAGNIEDFASKEKGILITAGRYSGLDLAGESCQVGVITRLPVNVDPIDYLNRTVLEDSRYLEEKVAHRLTQAFGRLNRDETDKAVYFVLDRRFETELTEPLYFRHVPIELAAQTEMGYLQCEGDPQKAIKVGKDFLAGRYLEYEVDLDKSIRGLVSDFGQTQFEGAPASWILREVKGWHELTNVNNYDAAYGLFKACYEDVQKKAQDAIMARKAAWFSYMMATAAYLHYRLQKGGKTAKDQVKQALKQSLEAGKNHWFSDLRMVLNELEEVQPPVSESTARVLQHKEEVIRRWIEFNRRFHKDPSKRLEHLLEVVEKGTHPQVCDALEELTNLFGFDSERPAGQGMPDLVIHAFACDQPFVSPWEIKTQDEGGVVSKADVTQAKGQQSVYARKFQHYTVHPALFSNRAKIDELAIDHARGAVNIILPKALKRVILPVFPHVLGAKNIEDTYESRIAYGVNVPNQESLLPLLTPEKNPAIE